MNRITTKDLSYLVDYLNKITNSPLEPYTRICNEQGSQYTANYHIDSAYGGVKLVRTCNEGGIHEVLNTGYTTKRNLYNVMRAYIAGIETTKE